VHRTHAHTHTHRHRGVSVAKEKAQFYKLNSRHKNHHGIPRNKLLVLCCTVDTTFHSGSRKVCRPSGNGAYQVRCLGQGCIPASWRVATWGTDLACMFQGGLQIGRWFTESGEEAGVSLSRNWRRTSPLDGAELGKSATHLGRIARYHVELLTCHQGRHLA
jgi:hypothetical protein